jgi:hypothetical protein
MIYRDLKSRGIAAERPMVGNGLWVTNVIDPDGYCLVFESPTQESRRDRLRGKRQWSRMKADEIG